MKTKLNKKSIAATLAAIVLFSGAFLISHKLHAQYATLCDISYEDGSLAMSCISSNTQDCVATLTIISTSNDTTVLKFRCSGKTIKTDNDHLIFNPIAH